MNEQPEKYTSGRGAKIWYLPSKGKNYYHRLDGPAFEEADGTKYWFVDGKVHRLDGPAVEFASGTKAWWINDKELSTEEVEDWLEENNIDLKTEEDQMAFKLRWS